MDTNANTEILQTAAIKRADAHFETAPRAGSIKVVAWLVVAIVAAMLVLPLWLKLPARMSWSMLAINASVVVVLVAGWFISSIRGITLSGQALSINLTFWSARFDLAGLRSIGVDAEALKGGLRTFGNGGLGAFHGSFWSKRLGKFRGYITDARRCVVLRWENKCVVVSPKDTEYFIEEVCKRTSVRRQT